MMKRCLVIVMFIGCVLVGCVACSMPGDSGTNSTGNTSSQSTTKNVSTPSATPTPTAASTLSASSVQSIPTAMNYYQAIKQKDYVKAFSFVDANATTQDGKKLTENLLAQMASSQDANYGPISNVEMMPASNDGTQITLTLDRGSGLHYHTHLTMKKEGSDWKIVSLDRI